MTAKLTVDGQQKVDRAKCGEDSGGSRQKPLVRKDVHNGHKRCYREEKREGADAEYAFVFSVVDQSLAHVGVKLLDALQKITLFMDGGSARFGSDTDRGKCLNRKSIHEKLQIIIA